MAKNQKMDVLSLIEADHRKVEQLFEQAEKASGKQLYDSFGNLYTELNLHARAEELSIYPAMQEYKETKKFIEEAEAEHEQAEVLLEQMKQMKLDDPAFRNMLQELKAAVQHHVEEEENEVFPAVRKCMDEQQLMELGQEFQNVKPRFEGEVKEAIAQ